MKKLLFVILLFVSLTSANKLKNEIKNIVGEYEYQTHNNLINLLFTNETQYYKNNKINYIKTLNTLKSNGLLKLGVTNSRSIDITFDIPDNPTKTIKILNSIIKSMGYYYFFTKNASYDEQQIFKWNITLNTKTVLDPIQLVDKLERHFIYIVNIKKYPNQNWNYRLDTTQSFIASAKPINPNSTTILTKPFDNYFLSIPINTNKIKIISFDGDNWYPYIVFFDENLKPIDAITNSTSTKTYTQRVPTGTKYIKLGDNYNLKNIKRGLTIKLLNN